MSFGDKTPCCELRLASETSAQQSSEFGCHFSEQARKQSRQDNDQKGCDRPRRQDSAKRHVAQEIGQEPRCNEGSGHKRAQHACNEDRADQGRGDLHLLHASPAIYGRIRTAPMSMRSGLRIAAPLALPGRMDAPESWHFGGALCGNPIQRNVEPAPSSEVEHGCVMLNPPVIRKPRRSRDYPGSAARIPLAADPGSARFALLARSLGRDDGWKDRLLSMIGVRGAGCGKSARIESWASFLRAQVSRPMCEADWRPEGHSTRCANTTTHM